MLTWTVYLSGEIHSEWRKQIASGVQRERLPVELTGPVTNHAASDNCGAEILGPEESKFWNDYKSARINAIRTRTIIESADIVVVRFAGEYREWNAAFDAGYAVALGKKLITLHDESLGHALKEVDASAYAVAESPEQIVKILKYVINGA